MNRIPTLAHLFATNAAVLPEERAIVINEVEVIDQTIEELRQRLGELERDRRDCLAVLSPVRTIPVDVLTKMFTFAIDPRQIALNEDARKRVIDICLVCKTWRQAAISTHHLWTTLAITTPLTDSKYKKAERWLGRAGLLPKSLALNSPKDDCGNAAECALTASNHALARFMVQGPLLDDLSISFSNTNCLRRLLGEMKGLAPEEITWSWTSIQCLSLNVADNWNELEDDPIQTSLGNNSSAFDHLPRATSFHLNVPSRGDGSDTGLMLSIPKTFISQLTTFTLSCDWNAVKILKLLHSCKQLRILTLDFKSHTLQFNRAAWLEVNTMKRIVLPELSTLRFRALHPGAFEHVAPYIKTPGLLELDMCFVVDNTAVYLSGDSTLCHLGKLLVASECTTRIHRIRFRDVSFTLEGMTSFLEEADLVSLEYLSLDNVMMPASVFTYLLTHMDSLPLSRLCAIELVNIQNSSLISLASTYVQARRDMDDRSETRLIVRHDA